MIATKKSTEVGVMFDIESLDTGPTSVVTQIAMVVFDQNDPENILGEVNEFLPIDPQLKVGRTVSAATLTWWMHQSPEARAKFELSLGNDDIELTSLVRHVMRKFREFIGDSVYQVWARGPQFDIVNIESLCALAQEPVPWSYSSVRDLRTQMDAAGISTDDVPRKESYLPHVARFDCLYQLDCLAAANAKLGQYAAR